MQAHLALTNLAAIADAGGARLADAAFVTVFLRDPGTQTAAFDEVYRAVLGPVTEPPARMIALSALPHGDVEVAAVIPIGHPRHRCVDDPGGADGGPAQPAELRDGTFVHHEIDVSDRSVTVVRPDGDRRVPERDPPRLVAFQATPLP
ncbi:RidA family protein [Amycolatopsis sp. WQ 127309]|nr:RidA family protein [Amycolatopsis sp. WQ 127309]